MRGHIYFCMFEEFECLLDVELARFSTMKIGGKAKWLIFPKNVQELQEILQICEEKRIKTFVLGNGSNVLFDDAGFDGAVLNLRHFDFVKVEKNCKKIIKNAQKCAKNATFLKNLIFETENCAFQNLKNASFKIFQRKRARSVQVGAGINLFALNLRLAKLGLSGLEFCYGIPATLGGFLVMNGGCFGHEICEFVEEVQILQDGKVFWRTKDTCDFSYRHSNLQNCVLLSAKLRLFEEKTEKILQNMNFFLEMKRASQPCDQPSLGSVFKAVDGVSVGKILDELGLKGLSVGGAQVSTKHAGFVVNTGGATAEDVLSLVEIIEKKLAENGIKAEREIIVLKEK